MGPSWFVDTSVLLLAAGESHPQRTDAIAFLEQARTHRQALHVSVEALQEFTFHRLRRVERDRALEESEALARALVVHAFDGSIMTDALGLMRLTSLRGRDAVHAATALAAGFAFIVSCDRDFDSVPGLRRLEPRDALTS